MFLACAPLPPVPMAAGGPAAPSPAAPPIATIDEADLAVLLQNHTGRLLVVNFWATWCGPCVTELATLAGAALRSPDVRFALVNVDEGEANSLPPFVLRHGIRLPLYHLEVADPPSSLQRVVQGWPDIIPVTLVVEPGGNVRQAFSGAVAAESLLAALR